MNIQWTYEDFVTKGPLIEGVLSWKLNDVEINRGTYRDEWAIYPMVLGHDLSPYWAVTTSIGEVSGSSNSVMEDHDQIETGSGATATRWKVPDNVMKTPPKTRMETVKILTFYNDASTQTDATTIAQVPWNNIAEWHVVP